MATTGFSETLAVVKAIRAFVDRAKVDRPQHAEIIEQIGSVAMRAMWRVYQPNPIDG